MKVHRLEVIRRASAPVHDVLVLTLAAQFAVPVGDAQVVVHHALTVGAVLQYGVEERLEKERGGGQNLESCVHFSSLSVQTASRAATEDRDSHKLAIKIQFPHRGCWTSSKLCIDLRQSGSLSHACMEGEQRVPFLTVTPAWSASTLYICVSHLGRQESVGIETLHVGHQVVLRVDDIFHKHAVQEEPV